MGIPMKCPECGGVLKKGFTCASYKDFACVDCPYWTRRENVHKAKMVQTNPELKEIVEKVEKASQLIEKVEKI